MRRSVVPLRMKYIIWVLFDYYYGVLHFVYCIVKVKVKRMSGLLHEQYNGLLYGTLWF